MQPDRPDAGATWYDYFRARFFPRPTRGTAAENRAAASELVVLARRVTEDPEVAEILRLRYDLALAGLPMPEEAHEHGMDADLPRVLQDIAPVERPPNLRGLDKGAARSALVAAWGAR